MAAALSSSYMPSTNFSMVNFNGESKRKALLLKNRKSFLVSAQQQQADTADYSLKVEEKKEEAEKKEEKQQKVMKSPIPVEPQTNVKSKNMGVEFGSEWLSSTTRHVRIYAAYIDPETCEFDQTQTDKLTLILDPTDEFVWTEESCNQVYSYFQELIDHYEGADLTEYTLRLIGSDIEHYIRKMLYRGEIQYNMNARVLNFSMGKPRVGFAYDDDNIPEEYL